MELTKGQIFIFSAPSGAGKTTIVRHVLAHYPNFEFSVSATTRPSRGEEQDGLHYYFLSESEFIRRKNAGEFLEWEEVYAGRYYGSLKSDVNRIRDKGHHVVFDVDVKGGLNIKRQYGSEAVSIFIQPPSLHALQERLINRGTDSKAEIKRRCLKAEEELRYATQFDYVVINDKLEVALRRVVEIIEENLTITPYSGKK